MTQLLVLVLGAIAVWWMIAAAAAQTGGRAEALLSRSQAALGQMLPDAEFVDTDGQRLTIKDFSGKPLIITLIYTSCSSICPALIENLLPAVTAAQEALGRDSFAVITIGFDTRNDTPKRMESFARSRGANIPGWRFVSADAENLDVISRGLGFGIYSRAGGFDHSGQVSIVDGEGRLYQQVYGAVFDPPLIVEPLKNLVLHRDRPLVAFSQIIDRVKFFCTVYDPASGRYYFNYSLFMGIAIGLTSFGTVMWMLVREWRRSSSRG